jgi:protein SCO1
MEGVTRRTCIAMGGVPVIGGLAAYAARASGLWPRDERAGFAPAGSPRADLQQRHLPNVPLVTHNGEQVRFYDDLVKDRKVVLSFVSSRAPRESRKVTQNLGQLQRLFGRRIGTDIFLYTIARTPEHDTPARMRNWAAWSGAGPGWTFLTGERADVDALRRGLGFASEDAAEDADPGYSVSLIRYGAEPEMRWGHCQSQGNARVLAHSMLLDFGAGAADPGSVISRRLRTAGEPGAAPIWNCRLLLTGVD